MWTAMSIGDCDGNNLSDVDGDLVCDENEQMMSQACVIVQEIITMRLWRNS